MRPIASVRTWASRSLWLGAALLPHLARADEPPPLEAPAAPVAPAPIDAQPTASPSPTAVAPPPPSRPREDRPVLALPGVTIPAARPLPPPAAMPPSLASSPDGGLVAPATPAPAGRTSAAPGTSSALPALPSSRFRGRVIESTPADAMLPPIDVPAGPRGAGPLPMGPGGSRRSAERPRLDDDDADGRDLKGLDDAIAKEKLRGLPSTLPARRPGFLGGRIPNPFASRGGVVDTDSAIRAEPRTDPAADTALKRRIEKQAVGAVGDRVKGLDVLVVGRSVTIRARGVKLLQRRGVRRALEGLPGLTGYRSVVEVVD